MIKAPKPFERNIFVGFLLMLMITVGVSTAFYYNVSQFLEANRMVNHTLQVLETIEQTDSDLRDVQVERRDYVISGDESFLATYQTELDQIDAKLRDLRQMTIDNPAQQRNLDELIPAIYSRRELATEILNTRRAGDTDEALKLIVSAKNREKSIKIEQLFSQLKKNEQELLNARTENLINLQQRALSIIVALGTFIFLFLIAAYFIARANGKKRYDAQQEIANREEHYRALVRNIPKTAVVLIDRDFRYTLADGSQLGKHGFSQETFEGKTLYEVFPVEICKEWTELYNRAFAGEHITRETREGDNHFITEVLPVKNEAGEISLVMVMWQDITERKNTEAEQNRLLQILNASEDYIAMFSLEKNQSIYVNPAGKRMVGFSEDAALATMDVKSHHPQWANDVIFNEGFPATLESGFWIGETAFLDAHGKEIPTSQMLIAHYDENGKPEYISTVARDISRSKQIENALRQSERRNRDLLEKSPGYVCMQTLDGVLLAVNPAAAKALGYAPGEMVGKSLIEFVQPERKPFFNLYLEKIKAEGELSGLMYVLTKDGEPRIWQYTNNIYEDEDRGTFVLGHAQDVTENIRIEQELRESRQMFEHFMNNSPAVSYIKDDQGRFIYASRHLSELFQVPLEEIYGKTDADFLPIEAAQEIRAKEENILKTGGVEETLDSIVMPDGKNHVWQSYKFPIEDGFGKKMLGGTSFDITEHQRLENLLQQTVTLQQAILNSANYTVISTDADGVIQTFNKTAEEWLGYRAEEIIGKTTPAPFHLPEEVVKRAAELSMELGSKIEPGFETFVAKARTQTVDELEWTYVRKDKTTFPVSLSVTALRDSDNKITGFLGIGKDITERKQMVAALKSARDAALESARLKSEFLANMSHEIRTPMNGIIGMSELLLQTDLNFEQRDYAETVQSSGTALLTIINDILDFSKIEAGKLNFETVDFDLQYTLDSVIELFAAPAEEKKLELASLIYNDVPTDLRGDPGRLRQVLTNLVGNAVKFTEKGEIVARVKLESETETHATLKFSVTDTGIGISEEGRKNLFSAFVQADGSITRRYGGTGLGLAISKQLTAMMDGEMNVDSTPGEGSTFWFTATFEKQPVRKVSTPRYDLSGLRVLVVDDNETNRKILQTATASWKMNATAVESGEAALNELRAARDEEKPYDIALVDLMMPEMDGFTLCEEIRKDASFKKLRLLLMPSYGTRGHSQKAKRIGIDAYVVKPISQNDLFNCLADIFAEVVEVPNVLPVKNDAKELVTKHSVEENIRRREKEFLILVAEDNIVNQKVIRRQIENLGFTADIVSNGQEALEAYSSKDYNLIFMDCQMPVLDGYSATEKIRNLEQTSFKHVPIVALTASAIQGDREKCIAAGMDEYISKPTNQQKLDEIINHFIDSETNFSLEKINEWLGTERETSFYLNEELTNIFNRLKELYKERSELAVEFIELFIADTEAKLNRIIELIKSKDTGKLLLEIHGLKGSTANMGANQISQLCHRLESFVIKGDAVKVRSTFAQIYLRFNDLEPNLLSNCAAE